jgi:hypothetical protein
MSGKDFCDKVYIIYLVECLMNAIMEMGFRNIIFVSQDWFAKEIALSENDIFLLSLFN